MQAFDPYVPARSHVVIDKREREGEQHSGRFLVLLVKWAFSDGSLFRWGGEGGREQGRGDEGKII